MSESWVLGMGHAVSGDSGDSGGSGGGSYEVVLITSSPKHNDL
jgi:hypothetical protein